MIRKLKFLMQISATGLFGLVFKEIVCMNAYQARGYDAVGGEYIAVILFVFVVYSGSGKILDGIFVS